MPPPAATSSTSGAATGPSPSTLGPPGAGGDGVGGRRQRAGPGAVRRQRRGRRPRERAGRAPPTTCPTTSRFAGIWSNPPIRIGKAALHDSARDVARPARPRRRRRGSSCTSTSGPTRWPGGSSRPVTRPPAGRRAPATASSRSRRGDARRTTSKQLDGTGLKRLHREWRRETGGRVALLLDGVASTYNVGSILRTAAAERVEHVWFTATATPPTAPGVGKTALGTERYLTWTIGGTGAECVGRDPGRGVAGGRRRARRRGASPCTSSTCAPRPVCLAIGHEDRGLSPATLEACDAVGFIPQLGRVGSLNVAVADRGGRSTKPGGRSGPAPRSVPRDGGP